MTDKQGTDIAAELDRLCCAETEGQFFDYVTEAVGTITRLLRERDWLIKAHPFDRKQCGWGMSSAREGSCDRCGSRWADHRKPAPCLLPSEKQQIGR